ncbi:hypothetical protein D3C78_895570 [compost metagenome]
MDIIVLNQFLFLVDQIPLQGCQQIPQCRTFPLKDSCIGWQHQQVQVQWAGL